MRGLKPVHFRKADLSGNQTSSETPVGLLRISGFRISFWSASLLWSGINFAAWAAFPPGMALPAEELVVTVDALPGVKAEKMADAMDEPGQASRATGGCGTAVLTDGTHIGIPS